LQASVLCSCASSKSVVTGAENVRLSMASGGWVVPEPLGSDAHTVTGRGCPGNCSGGHATIRHINRRNNPHPFPGANR
jgi:hypothetical protein